MLQTFSLKSAFFLLAAVNFFHIWSKQYLASLANLNIFVLLFNFSIIILKLQCVIAIVCFPVWDSGQFSS